MSATRPKKSEQCEGPEVKSHRGLPPGTVKKNLRKNLMKFVPTLLLGVACAWVLISVFGFPALRHEGMSGAEYSLSSWLFIRFLGLIYLVAFLSLGSQLKGLIGKNGILPASDLLNSIRSRTDNSRWLLLPTIFWFSCSDRALKLAVTTGVILSLMVLSDVAAGPALVGLWLLYLSFVNVTGPFLSFQWDVLLLETGFLAIFLVPWKLMPGLPHASPILGVVLLLRLLLFRLMFMSGAVKLLSGDIAWNECTAMNYHYETQPLPTPVSYWAHRLSPWFQKLSVKSVYVIELIVPLFVFGPAPLAEAGAFILIFFQILIMLTGNYTFFNLLTVALCLLVFSNHTLSFLLSAQIPNSEPSRLTELWFLPAVLLFVALNTVPLSQLIRLRMPRWLRYLYQITSQVHLVNSYGLFAIMTTSRPEIIIEGSNDLKTWLPYEFKFKPGSLRGRLHWVAPHQPRLDWQMWFAALSEAAEEPWIFSFMLRLLEGRSEVLALLTENPFRDKPPRYVRALLYDYHFTTPCTRKQTGEIWWHELIGTYVPPISLRNFSEQEELSAPS